MTTDLTTVDFHGATLLAVRGETPAETLVAMKPVVEGMGLDWKGQYDKIKDHPVLSKGMGLIPIPSAGGPQTMTALPLSRLSFWLATIQPNRVPDVAIRDRVIRYQTECADVLFAHFFGKATGKTELDRELRSSLAAALTDFRREVIEQVQVNIAKALHAELVQTVQQMMPEMISATLVNDPRVAAVAGVSVRELLDKAKALSKQRNGLNRKIGNRMRDEALASGIMLHRCARTGTWLFPIAFAESWMHRHGDVLVRDHNDRMIGQGVLRFTDHRRKPAADPDADVPETLQ